MCILLKAKPPIPTNGLSTELAKIRGSGFGFRLSGFGVRVDGLIEPNRSRTFSGGYRSLIEGLYDLIEALWKPYIP